MKLTIGVLTGIGIITLVCIFFGTSWMFPEYLKHPAGTITSGYTSFTYPENGKNRYHYELFGITRLPDGMSFDDEVRYLLDATVLHIAEYLDEEVNNFQIEIVAVTHSGEIDKICGEPVKDFGMRNGVPFMKVGDGCIFYTEPRHTIFLDGSSYGAETMIHEISHSFIEKLYGKSLSNEDKEAIVMNITESIMKR